MFLDTLAFKADDLDDQGVLIDRLSNHPDFVGIIPILLKNPESRPICRRDGKNPDLDFCFKEQEALEDIFVKF